MNKKERKGRQRRETKQEWKCHEIEEPPSTAVHHSRHADAVQDEEAIGHKADTDIKV